MQASDLEYWVIQIAHRVRNHEPIEDSQVEVKREWPSDHTKTARQLGGHCNAARCDPVLWIIGLDEECGVIGASGKNLPDWLAQVRSHFESLHPELERDLNVPVDDQTVVALVFGTDRAPFVVENPQGRERMQWKLLTDLPVSSLRSAVEKLDWYALRWKIETFFKILKSGCRAEEAKLRTATRLTNLISIYSIVSWRIFWLCMVNRTDADAPAALAFTETEQRILNRIDPKPPRTINPTVSHYLLAVARLGGYMSRARDKPPGNMVLWRGFNRLMDVHLGYCIAKGTVGN